MQTIQFIKTVRWIKDQFSEECHSLLFRGDLRGVPKEDSSVLPYYLRVTHELAAVWPVIESSALAIEILDVFDFGELLSNSTALDMAGKLFSKDGRSEINNWVGEIMTKWKILYGCLEPLERLTTPLAISEEVDYDEILTIELRLKADIDPPVKVISETLVVANGVYDDVCKLMCIDDKKTLKALYGISGSSFRFDLTGSGEPIKQLKKLIVELWDKCRHSEAEKLRKNITAAAEGLKLMQDIKEKRDKTIINDEDATKLTGKIIGGICKLFQNGATIREIDSVVTVSNQNLLEHFSERKLLPKPKPEVVEKKAAKKKTAKKKKEEK